MKFHVCVPLFVFVLVACNHSKDKSPMIKSEQLSFLKDFSGSWIVHDFELTHDRVGTISTADAMGMIGGKLSVSEEVIEFNGEIFQPKGKETELYSGLHKGDVGFKFVQKYNLLDSKFNSLYMSGPRNNITAIFFQTKPALIAIANQGNYFLLKRN